MSAQPLFTAKLLAGEIPQEIEQLFDELDLSLFPSKFNYLKTNCDCPGWSNPCKHFAAMFFQLSEEFDRDPFLMFKMRGMSREEMQDQLPQIASNQNESEHDEVAQESYPPEPLNADTTLYWQGGDIPDDLFG